VPAEKNLTKKLYRSKTNRYIGGVSGGLGEYFQVDANIFRILFIIFSFAGGIGIILYIAAFLLVPENPEYSIMEYQKKNHNSTFLIAIILIVLGSLLLMKEFGLFNYFYIWKLPWASIWALFLIVIGVFIILAGRNGKVSSDKLDSIPILSGLNKIYRSRNNRLIAGVCGGIGEYFNTDPTIIRLLWILASFASIGLGIVIYVILIFVFPEQPIQDET
jgi:phage shock protein PspC (stress-responsive transcriptional regulator)